MQARFYIISDYLYLKSLRKGLSGTSIKDLRADIKESVRHTIGILNSTTFQAFGGP